MSDYLGGDARVGAAEPVENRDALDAMFRDELYAGGLGAELLAWGGGWSRARYLVVPAHLNFTGSPHGGAIFSVADCAFGVASNSWGPVRVALAVEVQLLATSELGEELIAACRKRSQTRQTTAHAVTVTGADERLVVSVQTMAWRTGRWHLGDDARSPAWREAR